MIIGDASRLGICFVVKGDRSAADNEWASDLHQLDALAMLVRRSHDYDCGVV